MSHRDSSTPEAPPRHVRLYGNDHSPWVQAVLLGLHEKRIEHTVDLAPPLPLFVESGVLMPAACIDGGPWTFDSERILGALGFSPVEKDDRRALQTLFGLTALRRTDDLWLFFHRFSFVRADDASLPVRLWDQFWRSFAMFYFFITIRLFGRRFEPPGRDAMVAAFAQWQDRLPSGDAFIAGDAPDTVDLQLFGLVQMCASVPGEADALLRSEPKLDRLRAWISTMQARFADYDHLYTATAFEPRQPEIRPAPPAERFAYWLGLTTMVLAFPVTIPLVLFYVSHIRRKGLL